MSTAGFFKLSGAGNDFLALAEPLHDPAEEQVRAWCRRGISLGADGLFVLRRQSGGAGIALDYWNADGRPAELCLNGTRCAAELAFQLGWADGAVKIVTASGDVVARRDGVARVVLELQAPEPPAAWTVTLDGEPPAADGESIAGWRVRVGVPHFVLLWPDELGAAPVATLGRALRRHPDFAPAGTNVNFVRFPAPDRMQVRTYERGVEEETLACGSGVLASAAVGLLLGRATLPLQVTTQGGFELEVGGDPAAPFAPGTPWSLTGDARLVARGELLPDAETAPPPPPWM